MSNNSRSRLSLSANPYGSGSSSQGNSSRSFITNENFNTTHDDSESDESCQEVNITNEVICISSDGEEFEDGSLKTGSLNSVQSNYCSICKMKNNYDHDCSQFNKEFSTCLVPNCSMLSRSLEDIAPHYRQHIGMPSGAVLCKLCYKENKSNERDPNGRHTNCLTNNLFKCYACNISLKNMPDFAFHKLKLHNGRLINSAGNYLCFYCEKSSHDLMWIKEHTVRCLKNQNENSLKYPIKNVLPGSINSVSSNERFKRAKKKIDSSSQYFLFTCLKPSCNKIFQNFNVFKFHHRQHFETGNRLMCWQCCKPFTSLNHLRIHQAKGNCRTPGMFKCFECPQEFNDLQSLSVHKYTMHNGNLIINKRGKKTTICPFCITDINVSTFKDHLISCQCNNKAIITPRPKVIKKSGSPSKCLVCGKICLTAAALSSHMKVHQVKKITKNKIPSNSSYALASTSNDGEINSTLSLSSHTNDISNTSDINDVNNEINSSSCSTSERKKTFGYIDYSMFPLDDGLFCCISCPRKFSKKGIAKHWSFCSKRKGSPKINPPIYYCTECNESYTRLTFGDHWKVIHKKRLTYKKSKRFTCTKCQLKFVYRLALSMHYEHVHGELENSVCVSTNSNSVNSTPVVSEAKSLAETYTAEHMENDEQIKHEENSNTLRVRCKYTVNEKPVNKIENGMSKQSNELSNSRNNEEQDISINNENLNNDNGTVEECEDTVLNNGMEENNETIEQKKYVVIKDITTGDSSVNNITLITDEESQHLFNEIDAIIETQNEITSSAHKSPTSN